MVERRFPSLRSKVSPAQRQLDELLTQLEARITQPLGLWQRASVLSQLRAAAALLDSLPKDTGPQARVQTIFAALADADAVAFSDKRAALEAGRYGPKDLQRDLQAMPEYLWDPWVRCLFDVELAPLRQAACAPEMVDNVPTNVRTVLELAERLGPQDTVYDIGAGAGTVVVLLAFLTGLPVRGVEVDQNYAEFAAARCSRWGLKSAEIIHADACEVDYQEGTAFFLYDPFRGAMMTRFIERLRRVAEQHPISVFAFGACHEALSSMPGLSLAETTPTSMRVFKSG